MRSTNITITAMPPVITAAKPRLVSFETPNLVFSIRIRCRSDEISALRLGRRSPIDNVAADTAKGNGPFVCYFAKRKKTIDEFNKRRTPTRVVEFTRPEAPFVFSISLQRPTHVDIFTFLRYPRVHYTTITDNVI